MNIFVLSLNILKCAMYHCDQHVVKMILESAQMLCTAVILSGGTAGYKIAHQKHPCTLWALQSLSNWRWLRELAYALNDEFKYRYKRTEDHKSVAVIKALKEPNIPDIGLTTFAQAMFDEFRDPDPILAYRKYYAGAKHGFATWKGRDIPNWYIKLRKEMGGDAEKEVGLRLDPDFMKKKRSEAKEEKRLKEEKKKAKGESTKSKKAVKKEVSKPEKKKRAESQTTEVQPVSGVRTRKMARLDEELEATQKKRRPVSEASRKKLKGK